MSERLKLGVGSMMAGTRVSGVSGYESVYSKVHGLPHDKQADIRTVDGRWQIRQPALDWHGDYGTEQEALKAVAEEFEGPDRPGAYALGTRTTGACHAKVFRRKSRRFFRSRSKLQGLEMGNSKR